MDLPGSPNKSSSSSFSGNSATEAHLIYFLSVKFSTESLS